ncbi:DNA alkylation repair protein [bacterium]|nr:DNA alkylation repair protein [bacterium]
MCDNYISQILLNNQDKEYRDFTIKLSPDLTNYKLIGVRIPILRKISKTLENYDKLNNFLDDLPHKYFEETLLHRYIIENIKDYDLFIKRLDQLVPYLSSWALTDGFKSKAINNKNKSIYLLKIYEYIDSNMPYVKRFGIGQLMAYLKDDFNEDYLNKVFDIQTNNFYYLEMMISWFYSVSFCHHFNETLKYFNNHHFNDFIHNKTIQKCLESYRITDEQKEILRNLKRK